MNMFRFVPPTLKRLRDEEIAPSPSVLRRQFAENERQLRESVAEQQRLLEEKRLEMEREQKEMETK